LFCLLSIMLPTKPLIPVTQDVDWKHLLWLTTMQLLTSDQFCFCTFYFDDLTTSQVEWYCVKEINYMFIK
jgi:hypothetical protein